MNYPIIGLTRIRNESLILLDTLNHMSQFVDGIVVYDDASTDDSLKIAESHPKVFKVIKNSLWLTDRAIEETRHRQLLLEEGRKYHPDWFFYFDADERFEGEIRNFLLSEKSDHVAGIRINLFDAYLTQEDQNPYTKGPLLNFRKKYGPEKREILMLFKNTPSVKFQGLDAREPYLEGQVATQFYCQHYGKALSISHWEDTCNYYAKYFPKYSQKWEARKGKAIHTQSDFGRSLFSWKEVKKHAVLIHQYLVPQPQKMLKQKIKTRISHLIKKLKNLQVGYKVER